MKKSMVLAAVFGLSLSAACMAPSYGADEGGNESTGGTSESTGGSKSTGGEQSSTGGSKATGGSSKQTEESSSACKDGDENPCPACPEKVQICSGGTFVSCSCPAASDGDDDDDDDDSAGTGGKQSTGGSESETGGSKSTGGSSTSTGGKSTGGKQSTGGSESETGGSKSTGGSSTSTGGKSTGGEQSSTGGSTSSTGGSSSRVCDPGETYDCSDDCTNGGEGTTTCLSDGSGYGPCACEANHGTGGSSAGTGGTSSTGGTTSTGGSSTGGTTEKHRYKVVFISDKASSISPSFFTEKEGGNAISADCDTYEEDGVTVVDCVFDDPGTAFRFYGSTDLSGAGSWVPGREGTKGECTAYATFFVVRDCKFVPSAFQQVNGGCNVTVEKDGVARAQDDQDNDGVTIEGGDCDDGNPSIRPPQTPDDRSYSGTFNETCSAMGQTGTEIIRVEVPEAYVSGDSLTIAKPYRVNPCWAENVYNHEARVTVPGTVCEAYADVSSTIPFYGQAGGMDFVGSTADGGTVRFASVYVYAGKDRKPYGRYDGTTELGDFRYRITDKFLSAGSEGPADPPVDGARLFLGPWQP